MSGEQRKTVLVVDDVPDNIAIFEEILKGEYHVRAATDGEAALAIALSTPRPDLILLDVMMPGMDGFEVCRTLKQEGITAKLPVIFVTAKDDAADESHGFSLGAVDYLTKPVNASLVKARVKTHLELKSAREDLERQNELLRENARLREEVEAINRHDLKNPLMVVMNIPRLLMADERLTESQKALLKMVDDAGRTMLEMINRSVDLYKMETGTYELTLAPVDVLGVIERIKGSLSTLIREKALACEILARGSVPAQGERFTVRGEELLIYSMLANLLKNAMEASPPGGTIQVTLDEADSTAVSIHNNGAIPEKIRGRFFEKFATAGKQDGTGLGAYSAKLIVRTLGGSIGFETSEESGTTIRVTLPKG